jgi:acyl-homoserine lactone acylase PvdQ
MTNTMRFFAFLYLFFSVVVVAAQPFTAEEIARWEAQANEVTIIRDSWGIPHIYGKTDADVVFGLMYAQCEDDFDRVEMNYLDAIGRLAEVRGESALYHDLRARMFLDTTQAMAIYDNSPKWMKKLLNAFADGMNYFLHKNPDVKPALLTRFQPWMPLMFSEGSIGGNITVISLNRMQAFYENYKFGATLSDALRRMEAEPTGSNGFAIAPARSATGNALFLINPHTSFYFRTEAQMVSEEGLNAYGALTWGQFFIYQGFNENCGWMHTSSYSDFLDEYLETVEKRGDRYFYKYGDEWRPVQEEKVVLPYKNGTGMATKEFTIYRTHHGPVIGEQDGKWITIRMMNKPLAALKQSYLRTKAKGYRSYLKTMKINANSSNNTVFADSKGNIAYWHGNFIPKRNPGYDYSGYVDGSNPETDWLGLHKVKDIVQLRNPASGWIQNCNSTPFTAAGASSPNEADYPDYMAPDGENYRGINAVRVLSREDNFTLDKLIAAAYDPYLSRFAVLIPSLVKSYENIGSDSEEVAKAMSVLRNWNYECGEGSVATTLATYWGEGLQRLARTRRPAGERFDAISFTNFMIENTTDEEKVNLLLIALDRLEKDFGSWQTPWGDINRFQRLTGEIRETFDDSKPSIPVGFTSSRWGSLASFGARTFDTKKRYGVGGNSFVAVVEFGDRVRAKAIVSGGQSSDPASPHFDDQAKMFCTGTFRDVLFYPEEVSRNAERTYSPGQE